MDYYDGVLDEIHDLKWKEMKCLLERECKFYCGDSCDQCIITLGAIDKARRKEPLKKDEEMFLRSFIQMVYKEFIKNKIRASLRGTDIFITARFILFINQLGHK